MKNTLLIRVGISLEVNQAVRLPTREFLVKFQQKNSGWESNPLESDEPMAHQLPSLFISVSTF